MIGSLIESKVNSISREEVRVGLSVLLVRRYEVAELRCNQKVRCKLAVFEGPEETGKLFYIILNRLLITLAYVNVDAFQDSITSCSIDPHLAKAWYSEIGAQSVRLTILVQ